MKKFCLLILFVLFSIANCFGFLAYHNGKPTLYLYGSEAYNFNLAASRMGVGIEAYTGSGRSERKIDKITSLSADNRFTIGGVTHFDISVKHVTTSTGTASWMFSGTDLAYGCAKSGNSSLLDGSSGFNLGNPLGEAMFAIGFDAVDTPKFVLRGKEISTPKASHSITQSILVEDCITREYDSDVPDQVLENIKLYQANIPTTGSYPLTNVRNVAEISLNKRTGSYGECRFDVNVPMSTWNDVDRSAPFILYLGVNGGLPRFEGGIFYPIDSTRRADIAVWNEDYLYPSDFYAVDDNWLQGNPWANYSHGNVPITQTVNGKFTLCGFKAITLDYQLSTPTCSICGAIPDYNLPTHSIVVPVWFLETHDYTLLNGDSWNYENVAYFDVDCELTGTASLGVSTDSTTGETITIRSGGNVSFTYSGSPLVVANPRGFSIDALVYLMDSIVYDPTVQYCQFDPYMGMWDLSDAIYTAADEIDYYGSQLAVIGTPQIWEFGTFCPHHNNNYGSGSNPVFSPEPDSFTISDPHSDYSFSVSKEIEQMDNNPMGGSDPVISFIPYDENNTLVIYDRFDNKEYYRVSFKALEDGLQIKLPDEPTLAVPGLYAETLKSFLTGNGEYKSGEYYSTDSGLSGYIINPAEYNNLLRDIYGSTLEYKVLNSSGMPISSGALYINRLVGFNGYPLLTANLSVIDDDSGSSVRPIFLQTLADSDSESVSPSNGSLYVSGSFASPSELFWQKYSFQWDVYTAPNTQNIQTLLPEYSQTCIDYEYSNTCYSTTEIPGQLLSANGLEKAYGGTLRLNIVRNSNKNKHRDPVSEYTLKSLLEDKLVDSYSNISLEDWLSSLEVPDYESHYWRSNRVLRNSLGNPIYDETYPEPLSGDILPFDPFGGYTHEFPIYLNWGNSEWYTFTYVDYKNACGRYGDQYYDDATQEWLWKYSAGWFDYAYRYGFEDYWSSGWENCISPKNLESGLQPYFSGLEGKETTGVVTYKTLQEYRNKLQAGIDYALLHNIPVNLGFVSHGYGSASSSPGLMKTQRVCPYHKDCLATFVEVYMPRGGDLWGGFASNDLVGNLLGGDGLSVTFYLDSPVSIEFYYNFSLGTSGSYRHSRDSFVSLYIGCRTDGVVNNGLGIYPSSLSDSPVRDFKRSYDVRLLSHGNFEPYTYSYTLFEGEEFDDSPQYWELESTDDLYAYSIITGSPDHELSSLWVSVSPVSSAPVPGYYTLCSRYWRSSASAGAGGTSASSHSSYKYHKLLVNGFKRGMLTTEDIDDIKVLDVVPSHNTSVTPTAPDHYTIKQSIEDKVVVSDMLACSNSYFRLDWHRLEWRVFDVTDTKFEKPMSLDEASEEYGFTYYAPTIWSRRVFVELTGDLSNANGLTFQALIKRGDKVVSYGNYWTVYFEYMGTPTEEKNIQAWAAMKTPVSSNLNKAWIFGQLSGNLDVSTDTIDIPSWTNDGNYTVTSHNGKHDFMGKLELISTTDLDSISFVPSKNIENSELFKLLTPLASANEIVKYLDIKYVSGVISLDTSMLDLARRTGTLDCELYPYVGISIGMAKDLPFTPYYKVADPIELDFTGKHVWYKRSEPLKLYKWVSDTVSLDDIKSVVSAIKGSGSDSDVMVKNWASSEVCNWSSAKGSIPTVQRHDAPLKSIAFENTKTKESIIVDIEVNCFKGSEREDIYITEGANLTLNFEFGITGDTPVLIEDDGTFRWGQYTGTLYIEDSQGSVKKFSEYISEYVSTMNIVRDGNTGVSALPQTTPTTNESLSIYSAWYNNAGSKLNVELTGLKATLAGKSIYLQVDVKNQKIKSNVYNLWIKPNGVIKLQLTEDNNE